MEIVIGIIVVVVLLGIIGGMSSGSNEAAAKSETETANINKEPEITDKQYTEILERCKARSIEKWEDNPNAIMDIIKSFLHKSTITSEDAKKIFEDSVNLPISKALEEEEREIRLDEKYKDIVGKDKYLYGLIDELEEKEKEYDSIDVESAILSNAGMKPTPKNPVASATLTGAVLGTAAGVTAGAKTQAQNDRLQQSYDSLQDTLRQTMILQQERKERLEKRLGEIRKDIAAINKFDIIELDEDERDRYMKQIKCEVRSVELSESRKNLFVTCVVTYKSTEGYDGKVIDETEHEDSEFFDTLFRVDGVIKLIATYHGNSIGEGCVFGHTFGWAKPRGFHPTSVFGLNRDMTYIKLPDGVSDTISTEEVEIEFVPYRFWLFDSHSLD